MAPTLQLTALLALACLATAEVNHELDSFINHHMKAGNIPGLSAVAVKGDTVLWDGHYGSALPSAASGHAVHNTTVFEIASLSKTVIGMACMVLIDMGVLKSSDVVNSFLPFAVTNPHYPHVAITLSHLMTHTSSISDRNYDRIPGSTIYSEGDHPMTLAEFCQKLLSKNGAWYSRSNFASKHPGKHHDYSNVGASLAAYIVEVAAQKAGLADSFSKFVTKFVLEPIGITNAGYLMKDFGHSDSLKPPDGAIPSVYNVHRREYQSFCFYGFPDFPDGAFKSSALDYAKVFGAFINGGSFQGTRLWNSSTDEYAKTTATCTPMPCGGEFRQGNAFFYHETFAGRSLLGHNGGEMGIATEAFYNPETNVGFVVLTNGDWGQPKAFTKAFKAIELKLLKTFDAQASRRLRAGSASRRLRSRRPHVRGKQRHAAVATEASSRRCPCGLPCA